LVEFWRAGGAEHTTSVELAKQREAEGWDGQAFMDSQSLSADPYVLMGAWAVSTRNLKLATSTTNPLTRHPVVTAASVATLQSISGGRAILGIGRGDSALAYIGYAPTKIKVFRRALLDLQTLLSGGEVEFDTTGIAGTSSCVESLLLGHRPGAARLKWLPEGMPKVPLDVAATGPKVIEMSATIAERITFSVGAIPERIKWAVERARNARTALKLRDSDISYGAQIVVVCHPDINHVLDIAASFVSPLARFQIMQKDVAGPQTEIDTENYEAIRQGYDMTRHSEVISPDKLGGATLSKDFIQRFAIIGSPEHCVERLLELYLLGIRRFVVVGPGFYPEFESEAPGLFEREVIPAVRAAIDKFKRPAATR